MKMMERIRSSWFLAVVALLCFAPNALAQTLRPEKGGKALLIKKRPLYGSYFQLSSGFNPGGGGQTSSGFPLPEGGSTATYLLAAGICYIGAVAYNFRRKLRA